MKLSVAPFLFFLFFVVISVEKNFIYEHVVTDLLGNDVDLMVTGYKLKYCYTNIHPSRKLIFGDFFSLTDVPCMLLSYQGKEDLLEIRIYEVGDDFCIGKYTSHNISLERRSFVSVFQIEGLTFEKKFSFSEELFPEIPKNNNRVIDISYGFEDNDSCQNTVQRGFIRTSVCARNFIGLGVSFF